MASNNCLALHNLFTVFRDSLKTFLEVNTVQDKEKKKGIFLLALHENLEELLQRICTPVEPEELSYDELMVKLEQVLRSDDLLQEYIPVDRHQEQPLKLPPRPDEAKSRENNALTKDTVIELLPGKQHESMQMLIISPNAHLEGAHTNNNLLPLTYNESEQILIAALDNKIDLETQKEDFNNLLQIVSGVPLAVQICAAYISNECRVLEQNFVLSSYVNKLETENEYYEKEILQKSLSQSSEPENEKTIYASFLTTLKKINNITSTKNSKLLSDILGILNICAYLNGEIIPLALLKKISEINDENLTNAIQVLVDFSLINKANDYEVQMHRLIQDVVILNQKKSNEDAWYNKVFEYFLKCDESDDSQVASILNHAQHHQQLVVELYNNKSYKTKLLKLLVIHDCNSILKQIFEQVNNPKKIKKLVKNNNLLHVAVRYNHMEMVDTLLLYEDNLDKLDEDGLGPLMVAAARGLEDIAAKLTGRGAQLVLGDPPRGKSESNYMFLRQKQGHVEIIDMKNNYFNLKIWTDKNGDTLLHLAARRGLVALCKHRLAAPDCDVNVLNTNGDMPVHLAAKYGHVSILRYLFAVGVTVDTPGGAKKHRTALMQAASEGQTETVRWLLQHGASIQARDTDKWTSLYYASRYGHAKTATLLAATPGCDINALDDEGCSPLYVAATWGHLDVVRVLINAKAEIDLQNKEGWSPLHASVVGNHLAIVHALINAKANINLHTKAGFTPLELAKRWDNPKLERALMPKPSFQHLLKTISPKFKIPGRKTITKSVVPKLFKDTSSSIQIDIEKCQYLSITTDSWTCVDSTLYIAVTCHYITQNWEMRSACLSCRQMSEDHTAENIAETIRNVLCSYDIQGNKIASCTTDYGPNILAAVKLLKFNHVSCFGYVLNTGITNGLKIKELEQIITKIKKIQNITAHNLKVHNELVKIQEQLNIRKNTIPSFSTCWWALIRCIEVVLEQHAVLMTLFTEFNKGEYSEHILTTKEINLLSDIIKAIKPLEIMSAHMAGEKYITGSAIFPLLHQIKQIKNSGMDPVIKKIFNEIENVLERSYKGAREKHLFNISMFLDPRFKLEYFDENNCEEIKNIIIEELSSAVNENCIELLHTVKKCNGLAAIFGSVRKDVRQQCELTKAETINMEMTKYLKLPTIEIGEDPLTWWKINETQFPNLAVLARKYLCIQATSVACERVFSAGGNIITDYRSWYTSEQLIFLTLNSYFVPH